MSEVESAANGAQKQRILELNTDFSTSDSNSFTQIFEKLKKEGGTQRQRMKPEIKHDSALFPDGALHFPANDAQVPKTLNQQSSEGGFTRLLRQVSRKSNTVNASVHASAPNTVLRADNPGEFTRIINQSMLREIGNQGHNQNLPGAHEWPGRLPSEGGTPQARPYPASLSHMSAPENTEYSPSKQNHEHGSPTPVNPQTMLSGLPETSKLPGGGGTLNSRVAEQAASTISSRSPMMQSPSAFYQTTGSRLQEYVPFLLIANLFMTVLLLLLAGFALLHRS